MYAHGGSANNAPLRGGKSSPLEGGVRVSTFVAGGVIPTVMRGKILDKPEHIIAMADWCVSPPRLTPNRFLPLHP